MASPLFNLPIDSNGMSGQRYRFLAQGLDRVNNKVESLVANRNNTTLFKFEDEFDFDVNKKWMEDNWINTYYVVLVYLAVIFGGKHLMKNRPRFELRGLLALWSFGLAVFSIFGTIRVLPELWHVFNRKNGFHHSVCFSGFETNKVMAFWAWIFAMSKIIELGDTVFIVLRKQPLIFLHWYHHVTVLLYTWDSCVECISPSRWYVGVNFFVHSFMYTYYGLRALRYRIPKPIAIAITSSQLLQMVVGVSVNIHAFNTKQKGIPCDVSYKNINASFAMYTSYLILFGHFFYKAYLAKTNGVTKSTKTAPDSKPILKSQSHLNSNSAKDDISKLDENRNGRIKQD